MPEWEFHPARTGEDPAYARSPWRLGVFSRPELDSRPPSCRSSMKASRHARGSRTVISMSTYDVVIIGGGPAGLAAAVTLGRARRDVLVIDAGTPRNAPATQVHSYLGREGVNPRELLAIGRSEVEQYGGTIRDATVIGVERVSETGLRVTLADETTVDARRVLVATGVADELPGIPGLAARWGVDVLHCAYCHGYEVRDKEIGLIASGAASCTRHSCGASGARRSLCSPMSPWNLPRSSGPNSRRAKSPWCPARSPVSRSPATRSAASGSVTA